MDDNASQDGNGPSVEQEEGLMIRHRDFLIRVFGVYEQLPTSLKTLRYRVEWKGPNGEVGSKVVPDPLTKLADLHEVAKREIDALIDGK